MLLITHDGKPGCARSFDDEERIEEVRRLVLHAVGRGECRQRLDTEQNDGDEGIELNILYRRWHRIFNSMEMRVTTTDTSATTQPAREVSGYSNNFQSMRSVVLDGRQTSSVVYPSERR